LSASPGRIIIGLRSACAGEVEESAAGDPKSSMDGICTLASQRLRVAPFPEAGGRRSVRSSSVTCVKMWVRSASLDADVLIEAGLASLKEGDSSCGTAHALSSASSLCTEVIGAESTAEGEPSLRQVRS